MLFFAIFYSGYKFKQKGYSLWCYRQLIMNPIENIKKVVIARITANPEHIYIHIKHKDFQKLAYQREIALTSGALATEENDYVAATVQYNHKTIKAKIRLKGDALDHLDTDTDVVRPDFQAAPELLELAGVVGV